MQHHLANIPYVGRNSVEECIIFFKLSEPLGLLTREGQIQTVVAADYVSIFQAYLEVSSMNGRIRRQFEAFGISIV
jgi:hypothetical protein